MRTSIFTFARKLLAIISLGLGMTLVASPAVAAKEKYASIVIDLRTDQVLHARNADDKRYPASLTKAMTLYMLFDELKRGTIRLNEKMPVSLHAARQPPSSLGLKAGTTITVSDAIYALVTKSANDVAAVVAERLGQSESRFAVLMTVKAQAIGMKNTRFANASGLPDTRQISTARDMAILAKRLLHDHPGYYGYFANSRFSWKNRIYNTHNRLIGTVDGVDGIKTGYTQASGFNLITSAKRGGRRVIVVMFGGSSARSRDQHVAALLEAAYKSFKSEKQSKSKHRAFSQLRPSTSSFPANTPDTNSQSVENNQKIRAEGDEGSKLD